MQLFPIVVFTFLALMFLSSASSQNKEADYALVDSWFANSPTHSSNSHHDEHALPIPVVHVEHGSSSAAALAEGQKEVQRQTRGERISAGKKGKPWSAKRREAFESMSDERARVYGQRISASRKGKPWTEKRREAERQMLLDGRTAMRADKLSRANLGKKWGSNRKKRGS